MKKIFYIKSVLLLMTLLAFSCKESIMDYPNPNTYGTDNYFNTPDEIQKAAIATYAAFYYNSQMMQLWEEDLDVLGNESDPAPAARTNEPNVMALWKYQSNNTNNEFASKWRMLYKMVLRANLTIDKGNEYLANNGQDDLVSRSIGEASFLRGWAYFQLAFYWGRVPMRTTYDQTTNIDAPRAATADAVWSVAEADLKKAQELLPDSYDNANLGRATQRAATGFLGKLYLYNKKYAEAEAEFSKLDGKCSLLPKERWEDNFGETNENNSESVFEVQMVWRDGNNQWGNFTEPEGGSAPCTQTVVPQLYSWLDWANWRFQPLRVLDFKYKTESGIDYADPRAHLTFYEKNAPGSIGSDFYGSLILGGPFPFNQDYPWYRKGTNKEIRLSENNMQSGNNVRLMRYADVLLMRAECKIQTGDITGGIGFINQVRSRIGAFTYLGTYTQTQAFDLLKRERILELVGERHRFNDLKRWEILKETLNPELVLTGSTPSVTDKHYLFPIPQLEIDTNNGIKGDVKDNWN
jgi:hypothetical protein